MFSLQESNQTQLASEVLTSVSDCEIFYIHSIDMYIKLLLHPIVHVYTRKCAVNVVENTSIAW